MSDFLLELLSEEIPARMQEKACADLARLFADELAKAGLPAPELETYATPRRLALIARDLPAATLATTAETKGPRAGAPPQALEGFLRKTGLTADQLVERGGVLFAVVEKPGRATADVLAAAIPAIVRAFPWPKSMRWGTASASPGSLRWVRPLHGIVALLGDAVVPCEVDGIASGGVTVGHRFHHPAAITIAGARDYVEKLRAAHVIVDQRERQAIVRGRAEALAAEAGLRLVPDEGLVAENAGLTEWPVPLLGRFDPAFLAVPREVIQLSMRANQKYFALTEADGKLAPNFICTANLAAADGGAAIVAGNAKVLAARLSDARFFWDQDRKVPLAEQAEKLDRIVFHEKLGTVADKVARVAKLARWLVEEGIVKSSPERGGGPSRGDGGGGAQPDAPPVETPLHQPAAGPPPRAGEDPSLADMAERAGLLCKADLVTGMVGEFPELQGVIGGYYARAEGYPAAVADAIRDHYKPVGQGDDVPTAPVTVAVSLADKLDTLIAFFWADIRPTGSRDPFALRRAALAVVALILKSNVRARLADLFMKFSAVLHSDELGQLAAAENRSNRLSEFLETMFMTRYKYETEWKYRFLDDFDRGRVQDLDSHLALAAAERTTDQLLELVSDRLKVQQREAGVRHDLIDAVFALGGEDDLVRLLARVKALQAFVATEDGANLLAGYRRAANIVRIEARKDGDAPSPQRGEGWGEGERGEAERPTSEVGDPHPTLSHMEEGYAPEPAEAALSAALDIAEPAAAAAVAAEDFEGAMQALARLRPAVDAFFDRVTVNDPDRDKRAARLALLDRIRVAVHNVADFSRIVEG